MKPNLQKKIAEYKQNKSKKSHLQNLISQKRRNLQKMMSSSQIEVEKQNDFRIQNYAHQIDLKHNKYLQDMDQLQATKFKIIQLKGTLDSLQLQMSYQEDNLANWNRSYQKEVSALQQIVEQTRVRIAKERAEKVKMEEERCERQLQHVKKLTNQKAELIGRSSQLLEKVKLLKLNNKKIKQNFEEDYRKQKDIWAKSEQQRKQKWQAKKLEQVTQNTLRGLQPQIQRIVNSSKKDIQRIQQKYQLLKNQFKKQMNNQYQSNLKQIKKGIFDRVEEQKLTIMDRSNEQYRKRIQTLEQFYSGEKMKLKIGKEAEVRQLEQKRKFETEQFLTKNKQFMLTHLSQVQQLRSKYQMEIRQLDASLDKLLQKEEKDIRDKYTRKLEGYKQEKRKQLEQKVKAIHFKRKQQNENCYEDIVEKVAYENQIFERKTKEETQKKVRQFKQTYEVEIKNIRKGLQSWLNKQNQENQLLKNTQQASQSIEDQYNQLLRQCQYLKKKQLEYQAEVVKLKAKEGDFAQAEEEQRQKIGQHWNQQFQILKKKINQVEQEAETQEVVIRQKMEQEEGKNTKMFNELQEASLKILKKLNSDIERARKQKEMKVVLNKKLQEAKKKMKDLQAKRKNDFKL